MREERIVIAGRELLIARPDDPESLIDEERFEEDEFLPYWAELWPSGVALARYVASLDLTGTACSSSAAGWRCRRSLPPGRVPRCSLPTGRPRPSSSLPGTLLPTASTSQLQFSHGRTSLTRECGQFELVLAADVLYEERNARLLLACSKRSSLPLVRP